jgi:hypothetical protein
MELDIDRLYKALRAADAAGDVEGARLLAAETQTAIKELQRRQRVQDIQFKNPTEYMPQTEQYQGKYGPLRGTASNLAAGAGKSFVDIGRGVKQLTGNMTREEVDESRQLDAALTNTKSGFVGNLGGNIAAYAPAAFIPGANTYLGAALIGAGSGALQPVGVNDSRISNMALGAAGGVAGKYIGGKVGDWASGKPQPMSPERAAAISAAEANAISMGGDAASDASLQGSLNVSMRGGGSGFGSLGDDASAGLTRAQQEVMRRGQAIGMKLTPGQATGSKMLQQLEAKLESQPMTSGPFNAIKANNARVLAREAAAAIGENSDELSSGTLDKAFTRISGVFDDAADNVPRTIDPKEFIDTFQGIQQEVDGLTKGFNNHALLNQLVEHAERGAATGKQLQTLTSKLGKAAYKEMTTPSGDRELGQALYSVKDYVDNLLQSGMSGDRLKRFQTARTQYRNLLNLTSRTGITNPSTGDVSGRSLANLLQQKDKAGFLRGQNKTGMYDAARFAQAFAPIVGDSGTATRSMITNPLEMAASLPFNMASRAYASAPSVALATKAGAVANTVGRAGPLIRRGLGTAPFYAPYAGAPLGSVLFPQLLAE